MIKQYQNTELKFCKVRKGEKRPLEKDWTNTGYTYSQILDWINEGNNFGVIGGFGDLIIIDSDEPELQEAVDASLPQTFRVKTGGGGTHDYYFCSEIKKKIVLQNGKHYGEVQSYGSQVVAAGSVHPNGNTYEVLNDIPIRTISKEQLMICIKPFMKEVVLAETQAVQNLKEYGESDINSIPIASIINTTGFRRQGAEIYGANPWHGSTGGMNLWINPSKNVAHCWRCDCGVNVAQAIALNEGIIQNCDDKLSMEQFLEVLKIAQDKHNLPKPKSNIILKKKQINILEGDFFDTWDKVKGHTINTCKDKGELYFLAHNKDKISGKPQLIVDTMQQLPVLTMAIKTKDGEDLVSYKFIDDRYDRRYDGYEADKIFFRFWLYRLVQEGVEYYVLSQKKLDNDLITLRGMKIAANNFAELSKTLKFRSISNVFIATSSEPTIQVMEKSKLIALCKDLHKEHDLTWDSFKDLMYTDLDDDKIYDHPEDFNILQIAQLLSGKFEKYPMHLFILGPVGTGKSTHLECLAERIKESQGILEAANSTPKVLIPSFKEKPANPGYILKCVRMGFVDELLKMIEREDDHNNARQQNALGRLNMLLEHKSRTIGSGNDNTLHAKATAKLIFSSNPMAGRRTIYEHVGIIDDTTLSRMMIWVQDKEEQNMIYDKNIRKNTHTMLKLYKVGIGLYDWKGVRIDIVLSIVDSCNAFLVDYDTKALKGIFMASVGNVKSSMRNVWKSRGLHHCTLLLDGIVKQRCLFKDFDDSFIAKSEDYILLAKIINHMISTWDTDVGVRRGEFEEF